MSQCIQIRRWVQDNLLNIKSSGFSDQWTGTVPDGYLSISVSTIYLNFPTQSIPRAHKERSQKENLTSGHQLCGQKCLDVTGQRRMSRLVQGDKGNCTLQQRNQNTNSAHWTLKNMGYSSRRPHLVSLTLAKNSKVSLKLSQIIKFGENNIWKILISAATQMVGLEFGRNNMNTWMMVVVV